MILCFIPSESDQFLTLSVTHSRFRDLLDVRGADEGSFSKVVDVEVGVKDYIGNRQLTDN